MEDTGEASSTCQMCGRNDIRYVHTMAHRRLRGTLDVGCVCASKMEDDYTLAPAREAALRSRARRRAAFIRRDWKASRSRNLYCKVSGVVYVVLPDKFRPGCWRLSRDGEFVPGWFVSIEGAKAYAFDRENPKSAVWGCVE